MKKTIVTVTALLLISGAASAEPPADRTARDVLFAMTDTLAAAPGLSVNIRSGFDVMQASGQKVQFLENRQLTLARPNKLRLDTQARTAPSTLHIQPRPQLAARYDKGIAVHGPDVSTQGRAAGRRALRPAQGLVLECREPAGGFGTGHRPARLRA